jgi:hypothetical protein
VVDVTAVKRLTGRSHEVLTNLARGRPMHFGVFGQSAAAVDAVLQARVEPGQP